MQPCHAPTHARPGLLVTELPIRHTLTGRHEDYMILLLYFTTKKLKKWTSFTTVYWLTKFSTLKKLQVLSLVPIRGSTLQTCSTMVFFTCGTQVLKHFLTPLPSPHSPEPAKIFGNSSVLPNVSFGKRPLYFSRVVLF